MPYWRDKAVIVTGGTAGLGRVLSELISLGGARLNIFARNEARLLDTANQLKALSPDASVETNVVDVANLDEVIDAVARVRNQHGRIDALVNCVGASMRHDLSQAVPQQFRDQMAVNFFSAVNCTQTCLPYLLETKGLVVNISSLAGRTVWPWMGAYVASKHALTAYSRQLRLELGDRLRVITVYPGPIRRDDAGKRYGIEAAELPQQAHLPGAGAPLRGIDPDKLGRQIIKACETGKPELIVPGKAYWLFLAQAFSTRIGDWMLARMSRRP